MALGLALGNVSLSEELQLPPFLALSLSPLLLSDDFFFNYFCSGVAWWH